MKRTVSTLVLAMGLSSGAAIALEHADEVTTLDVIEVVDSGYDTPVSPADLSMGSQLYASCVGCHAEDGSGGVGPALMDREVGEVEEMIKAYANGEVATPMSGMMTPMVANLTDAEISALSLYISESFYSGD